MVTHGTPQEVEAVRAMKSADVQEQDDQPTEMAELEWALTPWQVRSIQVN